MTLYRVGERDDNHRTSPTHMKILPTRIKVRG